MTREEIQKLVEELEKKKENKEELTVVEACILDLAHGAKKKILMIKESMRNRFDWR